MMENSVKRNIIRLAVITVLAVLLFFGIRAVRKNADDAVANNKNTAAEQSGEESVTGPDEVFTDKTDEQTQQVFLYNFRRSSYLTEHFNKHGDEFGYENEQEYLEGANDVIADKKSLHKTEAEDGDHVFFQESTGSIVFVSQDGYIRTYFKPDDGIEYFNRQ